MPRRMSVAMTKQAVIERRKTVTRRKGWLFLKPGDRLLLVEKTMGFKKGETCPPPLAEVEVVSVRREPLYQLHLRNHSAYAWEEVAREGFPSMNPTEFVQRFFIDAQGMHILDDVTRIEWRYMDEVTGDE